jgi:hypothetical protein
MGIGRFRQGMPISYVEITNGLFLIVIVYMRWNKIFFTAMALKVSQCRNGFYFYHGTHRKPREKEKDFLPRRAQIGAEHKLLVILLLQ